MLKHVEIFQHFSKNFTQLKFFLVPSRCFLFFYLAPTELVFFNKTNYCSCSKWLKYYIKMLTLKLSAALLYRSGGVRNYFLYKAQIYLPTEDIKPFGQNGWSAQTWEPWLICLCSYKNNTLNILRSIFHFEFSSFLPVKILNCLKSSLILNIFYCFWMFVNKPFTYLTCAYLRK